MLSKLRSPWTVTMIGAIVDAQCDPVLVMEVRCQRPKPSWIGHCFFFMSSHCSALLN